MPVIAEHCRPDGWRGRVSPHTIACAWPDDCYVQWGGSGIVLGKSGVRSTAFFEAFPSSPKTFIRGEGTTVAEAEAAAHAKLLRYTACLSHTFIRGGYVNGAGICAHCGMFHAEAFDPLTTCELCEKPTYYSHGTDASGRTHWYCEAHQHLRPRDSQPSPIDALLRDEQDERLDE